MTFYDFLVCMIFYFSMFDILKFSMYDAFCVVHLLVVIVRFVFVDLIW